MTPAIASTATFALSSFTLPTQTGQERQVSESTRLVAVTDRSQDITLTTQEGDTVTLSLDQSAVVVYGRDGRLSQIQQYGADAAGLRSSYESLSVETREWLGIDISQEFSLSIDGDLNAAEWQDIRKALQRIDHLMGRTFGVESAATNKTPGLAGLDTLDGIEVEIQASRTILEARSGSASALAYRAAAPETPSVEKALASDRPIWQTAADEVVRIIDKTGIPPQQLAKPLGHLFRHWAGQARRHHPALEPMVGMMTNSVFEQLPGHAALKRSRLGDRIAPLAQDSV